MATVANKANPLTPIDPKYCNPNRTGAGTPIATVTPQYAGELYLDTTSPGFLYIATGLANTQWMPVEKSV